MKKEARASVTVIMLRSRRGAFYLHSHLGHWDLSFLDAGPKNRRRQFGVDVSLGTTYAAEPLVGFALSAYSCAVRSVFTTAGELVQVLRSLHR